MASLPIGLPSSLPISYNVDPSCLVTGSADDFGPLRIHWSSAWFVACCGAEDGVSMLHKCRGER
jgi:hypothetical protein